jgi:hypothetical protein
MRHIKLFEQFINEYGQQPGDLNMADEASQLDYIKRNSKYETALDKIENPSEKVQLAAVKANPQELRFIKDPSEKVQIAAVSIDSHKFKNTITAIGANFDNAIQHIDKPSEKVQLAAVAKFGYAIQHIKNPSDRVKMTAIESDPTAIEYIEAPSEELQLAAIANGRKAQGSVVIGLIENPTEAAQIAAITQNPHILKYINCLLYTSDAADDIL